AGVDAQPVPQPLPARAILGPLALPVDARLHLALAHPAAPRAVAKLQDLLDALLGCARGSLLRLLEAHLDIVLVDEELGAALGRLSGAARAGANAREHDEKRVDPHRRGW